MNKEQEADSPFTNHTIFLRINRARSLGYHKIEFFLVLSSTILTMFFLDRIFDFLGNSTYPFLFSTFFYPVDVAGFIEYLVGFNLLFMSVKKRNFGIILGMIICFSFSITLLLKKF